MLSGVDTLRTEGRQVPSIANALIVGGGIGGLSACVALRQRGVDVDLVEINLKWDVYGVGIIQPGNAIRAFDQLGLGAQVIAAGFGMDGDRFSLADGTVVAVNDYPRAAGEKYPSINGITRPRLHAILTSAVKASGTDVRLGITVASLASDDDGVDVAFTDGSSGRYDLVVGADGIDSLVRTLAFGPELRPQYTGQVVWRYNLPRPPEVDRLWMWNGRRYKAGFVPLANDLMYVLLVETPPPGQPAWLEQEGLAAMFRERMSEFGGLMAEVRELVTDDAGVVYRPIEAILVDRPWHRGRIALIGDAAHATSPHVGQGAAMAVEDVIVLAEEVTVDGTIGEALERWQERRWDRVKTICDISRQLGQWEIDRVEDADFAGLTKKSVVTTAAPI
jgi:2-polyprenyl-6-methoxyphenol hydroxylase-like FAD-dependent oxidoreductase